MASAKINKLNPNHAYGKSLEDLIDERKEHKNPKRKATEQETRDDVDELIASLKLQVGPDGKFRKPEFP